MCIPTVLVIASSAACVVGLVANLLLRAELEEAGMVAGQKIAALRAELDRALQENEWLKGVIERHGEPALAGNSRRPDDDPDRPPPNAKDPG